MKYLYVGKHFAGLMRLSIPYETISLIVSDSVSIQSCSFVRSYQKEQSL